MNYNWSWSVFLDMSPDGVHTFLETLLIGVGWTLALSLIAWVFSLLLGSCLGVMRTASSRALNFAGAAYVEVFRNIPLLVQMFLWYFVLPELLPHAWGVAMKQMPQPWGQFLPAVLCLGFYGSSRVAEQVRAGIQSLPRGQLQAGIAQADRGAGVPLHHPAAGLPHRAASADVRVHGHDQVFVGGADHRPAGADRPGALDAGIQLSHLRGVSAATAVYLILNGVVVLGMRMLERRVAIPGLIGPAGKSLGRAVGKFDFDAIASALPYLFKTGMTFTLTLTLLAAVMGLALGTLLAMMRLSRFKLLSVPAGIYVNVMRSIPLLLVIFWFYFLVPYMAAWALPTPVRVGAFNSAVITFTLFEAAYFCEIMRAGIQSISRGQVSAGLALGLSPWQGMRYVVLPQASQHDPGAAHARHHPVPGYVAGVCAVADGLPGRGLQDRPARRPAGGALSVRGAGVFPDLLHRLAAGQAAGKARPRAALAYPQVQRCKPLRILR